jgi:sodium-dependent dicarboxylate transporter 2/3/5
MMMVPIALAVISRLNETDESNGNRRFAVGLLLGIAYAASIGGLATLIGTPPNLSFARIFAIYFPEAPEISFAQWFVFGLPVSLFFLAVTWTVLSLMHPARFSGAKDRLGHLRTEYKNLGPMRWEERWVAVLFALMALLWLTRSGVTIGATSIPGWSSLFGTPAFIDDGTVAMSIALMLFFIPARTSDKAARLMNWVTASRLPWGIVLLFGGGFALASGFKESGLSEWVAAQLTGLSGVPKGVLVASVCTMLTFLTELTSNTATTEMVLPLLGSLSSAIQTNPLLLMIPATLSASCAFMLPVATPPNAIVFGSGVIRMRDMVRVGIVLNLIGIVIITAAVFILGLTVFGIDPAIIPEWAG